MGQFSWIDVDGNQNIAEGEKGVIMLIPDEHKAIVSKIFGVEITGNGIEGEYSGYGEIIDKNGIKTDVFSVMAFINICLTNDTQYEQALAPIYWNKPQPDDIPEILKRPVLSASDMRNLAKKYAKREHEPIRQAYRNGEIKTATDLYTMAGSEHRFRHIGISIASYDEQNARTPYPIKWTVNKDNTYENSKFSMSDPNQGFYKVNVTSWEEYKKTCEEYDFDEGGLERSYNEYSSEYAELNTRRDEILKEVEQELAELEQEYDDDRDFDDDRCL